MFCVHELTVYCCFILCCCCCFSFCCRGLFVSFTGTLHREGSFPSYAAGRGLGGFLHHHEMLLDNLWSLYTTVRGLLKRLVFAEVGDLTSWHKTTNCYRATIVCLDAKGLWKPGQSFILAGFTLSLPCSAPCGTEQIMIDTGCDPALPRNFVDHPADCNPNNLIKFAIIRPSTLNHDRNLWNCRGSPDETTSLTVFFSVSQRLSFNLHEIV